MVILMLVVTSAGSYAAVCAAQGDLPGRLFFTIEDGNLAFATWKDDRLIFFIERDEPICDENGEHCLLGPGELVADWYQYDPFTDTLQMLDQSPYLETTLSQDILDELDLCVYQDAEARQYIVQSPGGDVLLYETNRWRDDSPVCPTAITFLEQNVTIELGYFTFSYLSPPDFAPLYGVLWSSDGMTFLERRFGGLGNVTLVSLSNAEAVVTTLYPSPMWDDFPHGYPIGVITAALSPSGRYVLMAVSQYYEDYALYDRQTEVLLLLDDLGVRTTNAVWLDDESFLALTRHGIGIYTITDMSFKVLLSSEEIDQRGISYPQLAEPVFSPGGEFLLLQYCGPRHTMWDHSTCYLVSIDLRDVLAQNYPN